MFQGVKASPGIEMGQAFILREQQISANDTKIAPDKLSQEIVKLEEAIAKSKIQLQEIKEKAERELGAEGAEIFTAHLMILEDEVFLEEIREKIKQDCLAAEKALAEVTNNYVEIFGNMEDEYLRERAADIKDISSRLTKNILGLAMQSLADITAEIIIVAKDLTPSDTAQMNKEKVKAFVTEMGGKTSHTAIMARSLEIPAIVGLIGITEQVDDGDYLIVDGNKGWVFVNPSPEKVNEYRKIKQEYEEYKQELRQLKTLPAQTRDQARRVEISANIGTPADCTGALENGAEGIGLYRTEFLYMDRKNLPDEEEQFEAYKAVAEAMAPNPVIIRTLDIGGDKKLPYLEMPQEMNPFLGWRAIRMCLDRPDILKTQLRAIMRASNYGKLRIMYPMISNAAEIRKANAVLREVKEELDRENIAFDKNLEVGIMVEIPAAAVAADILAKEVDFFSIGTNDLIQYTIAVDRMNEHISHLYEPLHPAVLRLIKNVIDASHRAGKWTGMCGEMAGDVSATAILLGLGLDEFSMSAVSIPHVKKLIRSLTITEAEKIAEKALRMDDPEEIRKMISSSQEVF